MFLLNHFFIVQDPDGIADRRLCDIEFPGQMANVAQFRIVKRYKNEDLDLRCTLGHYYLFSG